MSSARIVSGVVSACLGLVCVSAIQPVLAQPPSAKTVLAQYDKDNDKTLDLAEAKAAASANFSKLDKDSDGSLDPKEVAGLIGPAAFKAADPDRDGTLNQDEYLALVQKRFEQADADHDGTLDAKELHSKAGLALRRLLG